MKDKNFDSIIAHLKTSKPKSVAICLPKFSGVDKLSSAIAFKGLLGSMGAKADIFCDSDQLPKLLFFSPEVQEVKKQFSASQGDLAITVSNIHAKPGQLRYDITDGGLVIKINTEEGAFELTDVGVSISAQYDFIVIIGAQNYEQLGTIYSSNTEVFFSTPQLSIDTDPSNEYFATFNMVSVNSSSLAEIVYDICDAFPESFKKDEVSTGILAGIIAKTMSFRDPRTTPDTLLKSARLIDEKARQQVIIQHLFKTKPLPQLQLWGRALARIVSNQSKSLVTAVVTKNDFEKTQTTPEYLPVITQDIIDMTSGYSIFVVLGEGAQNFNSPENSTMMQQNTIYGVIAGLPFEDVSKLAHDSGLSEKITMSRYGKYDMVEFVTTTSLSALDLLTLIESKVNLK